MLQPLILDYSALPVLAFYLYVSALLAILRLRLARTSSEPARALTVSAAAVAILLALAVSLSAYAAAVPAPPCAAISIFSSGYCDHFPHGLSVVWKFFSLLVFFSLAVTPLAVFARLALNGFSISRLKGSE